MKFILVRHTMTDWNYTGRLQGQTDIPLNKQGTSEVEALAVSLLDLGINLIASSDLLRAKETSEVINWSLNVPLLFDKRLRECSFGKLEGLTKQQAIAKYGDAIIKDWDDQFLSYDFHRFGGEHRDHVFSRHIEALKHIEKENKNKTVLIVGHDRGLCTLLSGLGLTPELNQGEYKIIEYS
ncbi:MAG: histidine phosphatase family protein [Minisyncoccia bacterium]